MTKPGHAFNLIEGKFTRSEASELLSTLFQDKVRFHSVKNFGHQERFGEPHHHSSLRIKKLEQTLEELLAFVNTYDQNAEFEVEADIRIKPVS